MSNKLTRKSLAFGAMVALASSVIAGAPAQAAGEVVFAPSTGTSYRTFLDASFELTASLAPGQVAANIAQLKYQIAGTATGDVLYGINAAATVATTSASQVVTANGSATVANKLSLALSAAKVTANATYSTTVTAFIDSNSNNVLDSGEFSQAQTVTFVKYSEVVPTVTLTTPAAGDTTLKASVSLADINISQLTAASYKVAFTSTGTGNGTIADVQVSATGTATSAALTNANVAADVITAQAKYGTTLLGTAVSATVAARTITVPAAADATVVDGPNAESTGNTVRTNSAFAVRLLVKDTASTPAAKAGEVVKVAVTSSVAVSASKTLSVNGTVSNATVALPTALEVTTDASGYATVNLIPAGFAAGDTFTVAFTAQNVTVSRQVTLADAAFKIVDTQDDTATANRAIAKGGSVTFNLAVTDQFGEAISGAVRIKSTLTVNGTAKAAVYTSAVAGKATVTVTDDQTAATPGNDSVKFELETQNASTLNWANSPFAGFGKTAAQNTAAASTVDISVSATAPGFDSSPTPTGGATKFTGTVAPEAFNTGTTALTNGVNVLNVAAALSTTVAGQRVTISGTDLLFRVNGKNYAGTVTTYSGTNGDFAVTVYSNKSGDQTVTFVTGSTTKTAVITFAAGPVALVSLTAPAQAQVGQALDVVVKTTDKWGNVTGSAVDTAAANEGNVVLSSTGSGYFANTAPVTSATTGLATVKYIVGTADIGTAFMSATLDLATDVTGARSVEFGLTDGDVLAGGKRIFVNAEFAKGRTVSVSINGKRIYSKVQTTDNAVELAFTQRRAGTYTVTVRISGGIVFTEKVTIN